MGDFSTNQSERFYNWSLLSPHHWTRSRTPLSESSYYQKVRRCISIDSHRKRGHSARKIAIHGVLVFPISTGEASQRRGVRCNATDPFKVPPALDTPFIHESPLNLLYIPSLSSEIRLLWPLTQRNRAAEARTVASCLPKFAYRQCESKKNTSLTQQ
jgi:hypothetical protein